METKCDIEFENNPNKVVYAGQMLRGTVKLKFTEPKMVRAIYIQIEGKANCNLKEAILQYIGQEVYLNETTRFIDGYGAEIKMDAGLYEYNFQCDLPSQLPTSVEGKYGHIRYTARVVLDIPMWPDTEFKERFTVIKPFDLNKDRSLRLSMNAKETCSLYLFGSLEYTARIPVNGYTPGEIIKLSIEAENRRSQSVEFIAKLIKRIDYVAEARLECSPSRVRYEKCTIAQEKALELHANSNETIEVNIQVPPTPPTEESTSEVVKVSYYLRVSASLGIFGNTVVRIPITIGTYPLHDSTTNSNAPTAPPKSSFDDQPPTYTEAVDATEFKPKYPVFKRSESHLN